MQDTNLISLMRCGIGSVRSWSFPDDVDGFQATMLMYRCVTSKNTEFRNDSKDRVKSRGILVLSPGTGTQVSGTDNCASQVVVRVARGVGVPVHSQAPVLASADVAGHFAHHFPRNARDSREPAATNVSECKSTAAGRAGKPDAGVWTRSSPSRAIRDLRLESCPA